MCYMVKVAAKKRATLVGVRELRQNLSVYLDRVKTGETLKVTEHGHVVAMLAPLPLKQMTVLERMVAEGRATPPTRSLRDLPPRVKAPPGTPPSEVVIAELREERLP
jgi:prevent-host-death family protein